MSLKKKKRTNVTKKQREKLLRGVYRNGRYSLEVWRWQERDCVADGIFSKPSKSFHIMEKNEGSRKRQWREWEA